MFMRGIFRLIAFLLLVGLVTWAGVSVYNAGVTAGISADIGSAIASGAPLPGGVYPGPYLGHPWGYGFGFFGIVFGIFFLFLIFGLLRAAFGWSGYRGGHRGWSGYGGHKGWGGHEGWSGPRDYLEDWHRQAHEDSSQEPSPERSGPDKA